MEGDRVFVDIGAHVGGSARRVFDGGYFFDRIISVEPDPDMVRHLEERFASKIAAGQYQVAPVGLSNTVCDAKLYGDNRRGGASLKPTKFSTSNRSSRSISLIDWNTFVRDYELKNSELFVKINAEGAEVDIIDSMLASEHRNIASMYIDYDIVKTPFGGWKKWRSMRALRAAGVSFVLKERVGVKNGPRTGLDNWLCAFPQLNEKPVPSVPTSKLVQVRAVYRDVVSACGVRLDVLKPRS